ncbi:PREDICTED: putative ubiquitin-conjugating enzyme E2 39 isoform X3 [Erythranthe guttata]|uniref:putative ubiquitin-conjugating enzyme E2 39 isoform X3 n=1 Tax=Erythranthe guttata TaxID=4155 RepID=UPI00064E019A|nr:PREDICTED: putative ubiquitin-conjugating enzyme E2 39 isoform X3 [Erythranthe guttata]|eukprot:XP_012840331.1 PREDICTED: putative ubiquitin-conjugating enzyme E2 39 isoform X3 [Erythranthe guttata]
MDSGNIPENNMFQFDNFGSIQAEPTDHYYLNSNNSDTAKKCLNKHNTLSTIMKEWKILSKNLPDSIYVRVYESRIDLLRAAILGPAGTPYHDGIFFFDILLPYDYPKSPPKVYYRSHGYRLNPNLYKNGYVCLSLINTWSGKKIEKWTQESTLLQILVSIQGLVLNERPYFNEPGIRYFKDSKSCKWINRSIEYSEDAFVLSCKTMLQVRAKPPQNFEGFVAQHFRDRAANILAAIKVYHEGRVLVGQFHEMDNSDNNIACVKVSPRFKENLTRLHSQFKKVFPEVKCEPIINVSISAENANKKAILSSNAKVNNKGFWGKLISSFAKCFIP